MKSILIYAIATSIPITETPDKELKKHTESRAQSERTESPGARKSEG